MKLTPQDVGRVSAGIVAFLANSEDLSEVTFERSAPVTNDPARCPWLGVYRRRVTYPSRTLGYGAGMRNQRLEYLLVLKQSDGRSGEGCEEALELFVQQVLSALLTDTTLGGLVQTIEDLEVQYPDYQKTASNQYMQTALIFITFIGGIQ